MRRLTLVLMLGLLARSLSAQTIGPAPVVVTNGGNTDPNSNVLVARVATPSTTYSASICDVKSGTGTLADTTNHANCKSSAGNVDWVLAVNTTGTVAYLRWYDSATDPTCSSATNFKRSWPIPANTTGAGYMVPLPTSMSFANGIGYCVTGGGGSSDNTAPPAGVYITIGYK